MTNYKLHELIEREAFFHHFQPLYHIATGEIIGYEVLFRSSLFYNPEMAFQAAIEEGRLFELEVKNIDKAIRTFLNVKEDKGNAKLFINVYPSTMMRPTFLRFLNNMVHKTSLKANQIILELNESEFVSDIRLARSKILEYQNQGFLIAIDDFGRGTASLRALVELTPNILKVDKYFVHEIMDSQTKQLMIQSLVEFCQKMNVQFIQEGIEHVEDLKVIKRLGVPFAQGYYFGRPKPLERNR